MRLTLICFFIIIPCLVTCWIGRPRGVVGESTGENNRWLLSSLIRSISESTQQSRYIMYRRAFTQLPLSKQQPTTIQSIHGPWLSWAWANVLKNHFWHFFFFLNPTLNIFTVWVVSKKSSKSLERMKWCCWFMRKVLFKELCWQLKTTKLNLVVHS